MEITMRLQGAKLHHFAKKTKQIGKFQNCTAQKRGRKLAFRPLSLRIQFVLGRDRAVCPRISAVGRGLSRKGLNKKPQICGECTAKRRLFVLSPHFVVLSLGEDVVFVVNGFAGLAINSQSLGRFLHQSILR